ncbi:MAG TPA: adenine phosphoribosyltransferase [Egibacteraceae bacterium]|jgi:adenine phosphoribosyltransferase|nr:adenine phosphoribosyltransferase [Egibacteraceae bacterium]
MRGRRVVATPFAEALLARAVRDIPDFPEPGVVFKDITPLLADPAAFSSAVDAIVVSFGRGTIDKVVGIEARGFIIAAPVAYHFGAGFVPLRKAGKLPYDTISETYELEYGTEVLEIHADAFAPGDRVLIVDDVLATGGTARAACDLVARAGAQVSGLGFVIELTFLKGADQIAGFDFVSLLQY